MLEVIHLEMTGAGNARGWQLLFLDGALTAFPGLDVVHGTTAMQLKELDRSLVFPTDPSGW